MTVFVSTVTARRSRNLIRYPEDNLTNRVGRRRRRLRLRRRLRCRPLYSGNSVVYGRAGLFGHENEIKIRAEPRLCR